MLTLPCGSISSKHSLPPDNILPSIWTPINFCPKFIFQAPTFRNRFQRTTLVSNQRNPLALSVAIAETARDYVSNQQSDSKNEVDGGFSRLKQFQLNTLTPYDCKQIHGKFMKLGVVSSNFLIGSKIAILYLQSKRCVNDARRLLDEISERTLPAYGKLIVSYCRSEKWEELFLVFELMIYEGLLPDKYIVPTIIKACAALKSSRSGKMLHGYVLRIGLEADVFVGNSLVDFYSNCGDLRSSRSVFDSMLERDVVSWTALISAYMDEGLLDEAQNVFQLMQSNGLKPDLISWNALISGFARNGEIDLAIQSFEEMKEKGFRPKVNSWNGVISGCVQNGFYDDALIFFTDMMWFPENPNVVTMVSILPACAGLKDLKIGKAIHGYALKSDLHGNIHVKGSLIDMYSKCGSMEFAEKAFLEVKNKNTAVWNEMIAAYVNEGKMEVALGLLRSMQNSTKPDEITYNTILAGYAKNGKKKEAYELLAEMNQWNLKPNVISLNVLVSGFQQAGLSHEALRLFQIMQSPCKHDDSGFEVPNASIQPNPVTITCAFAACADLRLLGRGKEIHCYILKNNCIPNIFVSSSLIDMYSKCHDMVSATKVFWRIRANNTVSWNSFIMGHISTKKLEEAFILFQTMLNEGPDPSSITFMMLLQGCSDMAALAAGRQLHSFVVKSQLHELHGITCALVDMYSKCGCIMDAESAFGSASKQHVSLWNTIISAYSVHMMPGNAFEKFEQIEKLGVVPDKLTFMALLSVCIPNGLINEGWRYFNIMENSYGISASLEHYMCMVGIMGAAGLLREALDFIKQMPCSPDACIWITLLQSCKFHKNPQILEGAIKSLFELEPGNASNYILLADSSDTPRVWKSAKTLRDFMRFYPSMTIKDSSVINITKTSCRVKERKFFI